jgi:hypothetical protein
VPYRDFDNFDDAIPYVKENPERYVIKPSGAAGNVKRRLFVGDEDDGQDVVGSSRRTRNPFRTRSGSFSCSGA